MNRQPPTDIDIALLWNDSMLWILQHTKLIAVAVIIGIAIVVALYGLRMLGKRLSREPNPWRGVIGRALASMKLWFMVPLAAQLVATYAHAPTDLANTIAFVFVITATFQGALFLRELILGTIEVRAADRDTHEGLANAIGLVRLFVNVVLFVLAFLLILGNLGVNVVGLVAGLGIGGIAIGLAAPGIFRDLFASIRDIVGGRSGSYEKVLNDARQTAIAELTDKAERLGANAVIGVDIDYETVGTNGSMLMVTAAGTAVLLE